MNLKTLANHLFQFLVERGEQPREDCPAIVLGTQIVVNLLISVSETSGKENTGKVGSMILVILNYVLPQIVTSGFSC